MHILPSEYSSCGVFLYLIDLIFEKSPMPSLLDIVQHINISEINLLDAGTIKAFQAVLSDTSLYDPCKGKSLKNYLLSSDIQLNSHSSLNQLSLVLRSQLISYATLNNPFSARPSFFTSFTSFSAVMGFGDSLSVHTHPNSVSTSTFYPLVHQDVVGGDLRFFLPDKTGKLALAHSVSPNTGDFFIFPSWLFHDTSPKADGGLRVCINSDAYSLTRFKASS